ncbi:hypothetical protein NEUTE2DRAFT_134049 [Neurospora tetrasperma FGSC 2509]|nr:hypothetical protein NEUTE2DRAFT_134049 [Neurospora tetrasperma FGSC 2509]
MDASVDGRTFPSGVGIESLVLLHAAVEPADAPIRFHSPGRYTYLVLRSRSRLVNDWLWTLGSLPCSTPHYGRHWTLWNCPDAVVEKAPRIPIGAMVVEAIPKYRRSASLVGALAPNFHHRDILTVKMQPPTRRETSAMVAARSHELFEVRGQQDWPVSAVQIVIRANSKKAISKWNTMNSLIFPAASRGLSQYTPQPGSHTPYHSLSTSAIKRHQTSPDDVDLGFVFEPYDLRALLAGTRDVLFPRVREVLGSDLASRLVYLLRALLRSDFNPVVNGRLHMEVAACATAIVRTVFALIFCTVLAGRYVKTHDKLHLSASKHSLITNYQARALMICLLSWAQDPPSSGLGTSRLRIRIPAYTHGPAG